MNNKKLTLNLFLFFRDSCRSTLGLVAAPTVPLVEVVVVIVVVVAVVALVAVVVAVVVVVVVVATSIRLTL